MSSQPTQTATNERGDRHRALRDWWVARFPEDSDSTVEVEPLSTGQSHESLAVSISAHGAAAREYILKLEPNGPGLVEPYDLRRQFRILKSLSGTSVPVPGVIAEETDRSWLGSSFYVMERVAGTVVELSVPSWVERSGTQFARTIWRTCARTLAELHGQDWRHLGLTDLDQDGDPRVREVEWWLAEIRRVSVEPFPAMEALSEWLLGHVPSAAVERCLVHGDWKWGNLMFDRQGIVAVLDWEMAGIGDPLMDLGYMVALWDDKPMSMLAGAPTVDEFLADYSTFSGRPVPDLTWYKALAVLKVSAIRIVGVRLFQTKLSDSLRFAQFGYGAKGQLHNALALVGLSPDLPMGPLTPTSDRVADAVEKVVFDLVLPELTSELAIDQMTILPRLIRQSLSAQTAGADDTGSIHPSSHDPEENAR